MPQPPVATEVIVPLSLSQETLDVSEITKSSGKIGESIVIIFDVPVQNGLVVSVTST